MKQLLILEPSDLARLKEGETLKLTESLLLSLSGSRTKRTKEEPVDANPGLTHKQIYNREYRLKRARMIKDLQDKKGR